MKRKIIYAAMAGAIALTTPLIASAGVKVGTLTCHESGGWGYVVGGSHRLACAFAGPRGTERYGGTMSKFGVNLGYQSSGTLVWAVFAPTDRMRRGDLRGHYGGVTGGASVGVGAAGNALVGGNNHTITLQPVSIEGMTGVNVAAGIGSLTLR
ncbi:MAG TPA: DUF992 domain-containing protein [Caulobacteraceae bacterium]|jgi:hypothetical protein